MEIDFIIMLFCFIMKEKKKYRDELGLIYNLLRYRKK